MSDKGIMKPAVAGIKIDTTREIYEEGLVEVSEVEEDDNEASWQSEPDFVDFITTFQESLSPDEADDVRDQKCFGWLWEDEFVVCPEDGKNGNLCPLRESCKSIWNKVQIERVARAKPKPEFGIRYGEEKKKRALKIERNKNKDNSRYDRLGYQNWNRPVDRLVDVFVQALGNPPVLPRIFNSVNFQTKYGYLGACAITQTANYHGVYHHGILVARFWTITGRTALVDVVPEVVPSLLRASSISDGDFGGRFLTKPKKISAKTLKKTKPCTHRVKVRSEEASSEVARILRRKFWWRSRQGT